MPPAMTQRRDERTDGPAHLPAAPLRRLVGRLRRLDPAVRGMLWAMSAGAVFSVLNALLRTLAMQLDPMQTQFLRYVFGCVVLLPLVLRGGVAAYLPRRIGGQFARGFVHTVGLGLWFTALPHVPMADMTALSFTGPIFLMIGAFLTFTLHTVTSVRLLRLHRLTMAQLMAKKAGKSAHSTRSLRTSWVLFVTSAARRSRLVIHRMYPSSLVVLNSSSDNYQETKDLHFGGGLFFLK